jgi:hypothetical protein
MALAWYVNHGILYPPLHSAGFFGGTRYMPIPILLHAGLARATGEYVLSGKLVSAVSVAGLVVVTFVALRQLTCPRLVALGLSSIPLVTAAGLWQATGVYADALPVALQLAGLVLVAKPASRRTIIVAAAVCALALFSKQTAIWGPATITVWLALKQRRQLPWFLATYVALCGLLLIVVEVISQGRFLENVTALTFAGVSIGGPSRTFTVLPGLLLRSALPVVLLGPLAVVSFVLDRRRLSIYHVGLVFASIVVAYVMSDIGESENQLLDVIVLLVVVVGSLWSSIPRLTSSKAHVLRLGLVFSAIAMLALGGMSRVLPPLIRTESDLRTGSSDRYSIWPLDDLVHRGDTILSEDPYIPIALGDRPTILDPFMLLRLEDAHPAWRDELVRRLERREFDEVILLSSADPGDPWYQSLHLGSSVVQAIDQSYEVKASIPRGWDLSSQPAIQPGYRYVVYVPSGL